MIDAHSIHRIYYVLGVTKVILVLYKHSFTSFFAHIFPTTLNFLPFSSSYTFGEMVDFAAEESKKGKNSNYVNLIFLIFEIEIQICITYFEFENFDFFFFLFLEITKRGERRCRLEWRKGTICELFIRRRGNTYDEICGVCIRR